MKKKIVWLFNQHSTARNEYSSAINWWYGALEALGYEVLYSPYEEYNADIFYESIKKEKPDFVFHPAYGTIHKEFEKLKEFTKVYVVQSDDDWRFDNFAKLWRPYVTGAISYQNSEVNYVNAGWKASEIFEAKWAFNPNTMMTTGGAQVEVRLSHVGGLHADRQQLINEFNQRGEQVTTIQNAYYENIKSVWANSKYSLTFTKGSVGNVRQKKGRVAEIPYFTFMLSEPFPGMESYYEPEKEIVLFESVSEAITKMEWYDKHPEQYEKVKVAGKRRLLSTNTCYHSWNEIMQKIDEDYKNKDINKILKGRHGITP